MINDGELLDHTLTIMPMQEGGFCVLMGERLYWDDKSTRERYADNGKRWAFSNATDLMVWLQKHANAKKAPAKALAKVDHMDSIRESVGR